MPVPFLSRTAFSRQRYDKAIVRHAVLASSECPLAFLIFGILGRGFDLIATSTTLWRTRLLIVGPITCYGCHVASRSLTLWRTLLLVGPITCYGCRALAIRSLVLGYCRKEIDFPVYLFPL